MVKKLAILGLGKMGSRIAEKLLISGEEVVVWNRSEHSVAELRAKLNSENLTVGNSIEMAIKRLSSPRIVWLMLPAGTVTQGVLDEVSLFVQKGDIIIDGGNSFYKDTEQRYKIFKKREIRFLGIGVSGGVIAEKQGYPLMIGGDRSAYETITPILDKLIKPHGGHAYFGEGGAGHFVKMVHNGVEYGMMQAIGEGFGVLEKSTYSFNLLQVAKIWQKGTIISSFLLDRAKDALEKDRKLSDILGEIEATGEAEWTIEEAKREQVPIPVIKKSFEFRKQSQKDVMIQNSFVAKMVAALRREFGGHKVKKKD